LVFPRLPRFARNDMWGGQDRHTLAPSLRSGFQLTAMTVKKRACNDSLLSLRGIPNGVRDDEAISRPPRLPRLRLAMTVKKGQAMTSFFVTLSHSEGSKRDCRLHRKSADEDINRYHGLSANPGVADADYASYRHNEITD